MDIALKDGMISISIDGNLSNGHFVSLEWLQPSCSTAIKESFIVGQFANYLFLLYPSSFTLFALSVFIE